MNDVDETLYTLYVAAVNFLNSRFPGESWEGAAAMYTENGRILISTAPDSLNQGVSLCHETGALCEAYKLNERVTASICVVRDPQGDIRILSPCGICQERLFLYGDNVAVAVPDDQDSRKWVSKKLKELQPHYWRNALL